MRRLALAVCLLLLVSACTNTTESTPAAGVATPGAQSVATAGPTADSGSDAAETLAFTAMTVAGEAFDGGAYAGKDLMLWFWAPW